MQPRPLNDWARFRRDGAVEGSPSSVTYGLAAVSSTTSPHPITNSDTRKKLNDMALSPGINSSEPNPNSSRPSTTPRR